MSRSEVVILNNQDLTILSDTVKADKTDLPKYWDRDYINERINTTTNHRHRMLLQFLWMSGTRITEAVGVRKQDLDFDNYTMRIRWLKNRKYNERHIPMHPLLRDILRVYTATMKADDKVFPMSRQRAWQITRQQLGGNPHRFRHSFAVNWLRSGGDIVVLSRMLGHSKLEHTMIYLRIVPIDQGKELIKVQFS